MKINLQDNLNLTIKRLNEYIYNIDKFILENEKLNNNFLLENYEKLLDELNLLFQDLVSILFMVKNKDNLSDNELILLNKYLNKLNNLFLIEFKGLNNLSDNYIEIKEYFNYLNNIIKKYRDKIKFFSETIYINIENKEITKELNKLLKIIDNKVQVRNKKYAKENTNNEKEVEVDIQKYLEVVVKNKNINSILKIMIVILIISYGSDIIFYLVKIFLNPIS